MGNILVTTVPSSEIQDVKETYSEDKKLFAELLKKSQELYNENRQLFLDPEFCERIAITYSKKLYQLPIEKIKVIHEQIKQNNNDLELKISYDSLKEEKFIVNELTGKIIERFKNQKIPQTATYKGVELSFPDIFYIQNRVLFLLDNIQERVKQNGGNPLFLDKDGGANEYRLVENENEFEDNNNNYQGNKVSPLAMFEKELKNIKNVKNNRPQNISTSEKTFEKKEEEKPWANKSEKPWEKKGNQGEKPFEKKEGNQGEKPWENKGEKPWANKSEKPFEKKEGNQGEKPWENKGEKPWEKKGNQAEKPFEKKEGNQGEKPWEKKGNQGEKPWENKGEKPWEKKGNQGEKHFEKKANQGEKPWVNKGEKPFEKKEGNQEEKPFEKKPFEKNKQSLKYDIQKLKDIEASSDRYCTDEQQECKLTKKEMCDKIVYHFIVRNNLIAAILSVVPTPDKFNELRGSFTFDRLKSLQSASFCLPPHYSSLHEKNDKQRIEHLFKYINNMNEKDCENNRGFFMKLSEERKKELFNDQNLGKKYIEFITKINNFYQESIKNLYIIIEKLQGSQTLSTENLNQLSKSAKNIIDELLLRTQFNYLLAILLFLDFDFVKDKDIVVKKSQRIGKILKESFENN